MYLPPNAAFIDAQLPEAEFIRPGGSLLIMVGLPGTGKSSIVEHLRHMVAPVVVSTDGVRKSLRPQATYTAAEVMLVYEVSYAIIEARLLRGQRVIFDASNYLVARREYVTDLATRCGAPVAVCHVQASQSEIHRRLLEREGDHRRHGDLSEANWAVYKWMVEAQEPVSGPHLILDTTSAAVEPLARRLHRYWLQTEASAARNPDLQPPSWASKFGNYHRVGS